jgi:hypothetical protein
MERQRTSGRIRQVGIWTSRGPRRYLLALAVDDNPGVRSIKAGVYAGGAQRLAGIH